MHLKNMLVIAAAHQMYCPSTKSNIESQVLGVVTYYSKASSDLPHQNDAGIAVHSKE